MTTTTTRAGGRWQELAGEEIEILRDLGEDENRKLHSIRATGKTKIEKAAGKKDACSKADKNGGESGGG